MEKDREKEIIKMDRWSTLHRRIQPKRQVGRRTLPAFRGSFAVPKGAIYYWKRAPNNTELQSNIK